jgi:transcriptional regulator GlxA family with amidase domain
VALVLFDEVELLDVAGVVQPLSQAGRQWNWRPFRILPVAGASGAITTRNQLRLEAPLDLESCPAPEILIVPGGYGARRASEESKVVDFVREHAERAELTAAIGHGVLVLARAGLLEGLEVAATPDVGALLAALAPSARPIAERRVVEAGPILTSHSGTASIDLGLAIVGRLLGEKSARAVAAQLGHDHADRHELRIDIPEIPPPGR